MSGTNLPGHIMNAPPRQRARPDEIRPGVMTSMDPELFGEAQARHLLLRAGFGGTPQQTRTLVGWGLEKSVDHLLKPNAVPFEAVREDQFDQGIMDPPSAEEREMYRRAQQRGDEDTLAQARLRRQQRQRDDRVQMRAVQRWWLTRMIETPRPLEEKMTLFWHGHFATSYRTIENSYQMFTQNQLFRKHALGNFGELMLQIIRDPAMLAYLDNNDSRKDRPNENLARELMELFGLGVGNYTERDIKDGARALTGYTFEGNEFVFRQQNHDTSHKVILGRSGNLDGDDFVMAILETRAASAFMGWKLYNFFAAETPYEVRDRPSDHNKAIRDLTAAMLRSRYKVAPVLKRLFMSEHFYSDAVVNQQIKSPVELVVGSVRSLLAPTRDLSILLDALDLMGQSLFYPPSVAGWAGGRSWINTSTLFVRQNVLAYLLTGKKPQGYDAMADSVRYDPAPLLAQLQEVNPRFAEDPQACVSYLLRICLGSEPSMAKDTLSTFIREQGGAITPPVLTSLVLLIGAMPEYQLT